MDGSDGKEMKRGNESKRKEIDDRHRLVVISV